MGASALYIISDVHLSEPPNLTAVLVEIHGQPMAQPERCTGIHALCPGAVAEKSVVYIQ